MLSGAAAVCWTIWKTRNNACFRDKFPDESVGVVYHLCNFINSWACLQKGQGQKGFEEEAQVIKIVVQEAYARKFG